MYDSVTNHNTLGIISIMVENIVDGLLFERFCILGLSMK